MAREARVESGVAVGFGGTVFEDAFFGGEEERGGVDVGFGAEGEELRLWLRVIEGWWEVGGCGGKRRVCGGCHHKERGGGSGEEDECGREGYGDISPYVWLGVMSGASRLSFMSDYSTLDRW